MVDGTIRSANNTVVMATDLVFVTVTCINQALLYTTVNTNGILLFDEPPIHINATLSIFTSANSTQAIYPMMDNFLPTTSITLIWTGFKDLNSSYLEYEYRIIKSDGTIEGWIAIGATLQLILSNLSVEMDQRHRVEIRATNPAGLTSQPIGKNFTVSMDIPVDTGTHIMYNIYILLYHIIVQVLSLMLRFCRQIYILNGLVNSRFPLQFIMKCQLAQGWEVGQ